MPPPGLRHDLWAAGTIAALVACVGVYVLYGWIDSGWFGVVLALVIMSVVGLAARVALTKYLREGGSAKAFAGAAAILVFGLILVAGEL